MLSEKQLEANRANAQKSTGPRTAAGKERSRLNACRHGLSGQVHVMPQEDMAAFKQFVNEIVESFVPDDAHERQLAQSYAGFQWRINRAEAIEHNMFTLGLMEEIAENLNIEHPEAHNATSHAKTFRADAREFERLSMYSQRLVNQASKVLKELKQAQADRKERFRREIEAATNIYKFHKMQETSYDPGQNGFALTVAQIEGHLRRESLESQARKAKDLHFNRVEYLKNYQNVAA